MKRWVYEGECGCVIVIAAANLAQGTAEAMYQPETPGRWVEMGLDEAVDRFARPRPRWTA